MCGIAGFQGEFSAETLACMASAMAHRGPDGEGLFHRPEIGIGLAHRRLAIIDLTHAADQPMVDMATGHVLVFNGEIYNYKELRAELVGQGHEFRTNSDTEVLLQLLVRHGSAALGKLNGIFALALWDARRRELLLARDGLGVKPLYYAVTASGFMFGSEIKSLLQEPSLDRALDPIAVASYLTYLWSPSPRTPLKAVRKLGPGMAITVRGGRIARQWQYYHLPSGEEKVTLTPVEAASLVADAVERAVERQMVSDVPVGAFLSGGLDSSAVVAYARRHSRERLQCFTIDLRGKAGASDGMTDDLPYARRVAEHLDVDLHTISVGPEMAGSLERMIHHLDEPQADPAPLNALFISQLAREQGIKVLLSGAGGDDIFTGYRRHYALTQERLWAKWPLSVRRAMSKSAGVLPTDSALGRRLRKAFEYAYLGDDERLVSYFYWLDPRTSAAMLAPEFRSEALAAEISAPLLAVQAELGTGASNLDRMLRLEQTFFLADHNLNYTDKMSMACGVEVRVPLLDPDLVELASRLPDSVKQRGRIGKWVFKRAMEPLLPRDIIYRPKTGFGAPLRRWLRHELKHMVDDLLSPEAIRRRGIFDPALVSNLIRADREGRVDAAYPIFAILSMEIWCRLFLDRPAKEIATAGYSRSP